MCGDRQKLGSHCEERQRRSNLPKTRQKEATTRLLHGACPECHEILHYAQNDMKRRARNDGENLIGSNLMCQCQVR